MSNTIKIRRGTEANLPTLEAGELGFTTDTHKVYVGDGTDNHLVTGITKVEDDPNPKAGGEFDFQNHSAGFTLQTYSPTATTSSTWSTSTAYALNDIVMPSTLNGDYYECTTAGTSGANEPTWSTVIGETTTDNNSPAWAASTDYSLGDMIVPTTPNGYNYECTTAGTSDSSEPTWGTTVGGTTADGSAVWTCRAQPVWTTKSTPVTIDFTKGNKVQLNMPTSNATLTFNPPSKPCNLVLIVVQDSTGSRAITWNTTIKWVNEVTPSLTPIGNGIDIISFLYDGTNWYGMAAYDFA